MKKINKNQLPGMKVDGSVQHNDRYTIAECESRGLRIRELAEKIKNEISSHFILYEYKEKIITDNYEVMELFRLKYPVGTDFEGDYVDIIFDEILEIDEDGNYIIVKYIPKWDILYRKLSRLLCRLYEKYKEKSGNVLHELCDLNREFMEVNSWLNKFQPEWNHESMDPIHVFASLNSDDIGHEKRVIRLNIYIKILQGFLEDKVHHYNDVTFDGCPEIMIDDIIKERKESEQKEVWSVFVEIMQNSQNSNIDFNKVNNWYGIDISSFTIFLFWIDAKNFLPLDKNTVNLLTKYNKLTKTPTTFEEYKELLEQKNTNLYLSLALISYDEKKQEFLDNKVKKELNKYLNVKEVQQISKFDIVHRISVSQNFKIIAIKPLHDCDSKYLKTLQEDEVYLFDKAYEINENEIVLNDEKDTDIYNRKKLSININAIVGKNGTGKSTIVELLFAIINNIAFKKLHESVNPESLFKYIENIEAELVWESTYLYKVILKNDLIYIEQYEKIDNEYKSPKHIDLNSFN